MVQPRAGQGAVQIALRLPPELRDQIKAVAEENGRSINSEIIHRLQTTLEMDAYQPGPSVNTDDELDILDEVNRLIETANQLLRKRAGK
ncbi:Arc family DNA-binding protein [Brucella sp. 6810]|uniref:Arc family DNA-binding protein n=1 Tax=Brucella sp. 6810 TaxID=2769351 RepID=UPI00165C9F73|nr:Arc family DNA-binding protein [Brucella sp. 6810]QNQ62415.1 Arc family DNA-binding protein [Brucella sp. 6810]